MYFVSHVCKIWTSLPPREMSIFRPRDLSLQPFCQLYLIRYVDLNRNDLPVCREYSPYMGLGIFFDWRLQLAIFYFFWPFDCWTADNYRFLPVPLLSAVGRQITVACRPLSPFLSAVEQQIIVNCCAFFFSLVFTIRGWTVDSCPLLIFLTVVCQLCCLLFNGR